MRRIVGVLVVIAAVATPALVRAQDAAAAPTCDRSWVGDIDADWNTVIPDPDGGGPLTADTNWTGDVLPGTTEKVCITLAGTYSVSITTSANVAGLTLGGSSGTQTVELAGGVGGNNSLLRLTDQGNGSDGVLANGVIRLVGVGPGAGYSWLHIQGGTLANAGTIDVDPPFTGTNEQFVDGAISNTGTMTIDANTTTFFGTTWTTSGTLSIASGKTLTRQGTGVAFTQNGGTVTNNGTFIQNGGTATFNGGTATGNPLDMYGVDLSPGGTGSGSIRVRSSATLASNVASGYTVTLAADASNHADLTVNADRTNNGVIRLEGIDGTQYSYLHIANGITLTNAGTLDVNPPFSGTNQQFVDGAINNTGTMTIDANTTAFVDSAWTTSGTLSIASGKTLTRQGTGVAFTQNGGTVTNNGTFIQNGGTATFNGGTATGNPLDMYGVDLSPGGTGSGSIRVRSSATLASNVASGYTVTLAADASNHADLTVNADRTNNGVIRLEGIDGTQYSYLHIANGITLTNAGTLDVNPPFSGTNQQFVDGAINNTGTMTIDANTTAFSGAAWTNSGAFSVAGGVTLTRGGAPSFTQSGGTTTLNGVFDQAGTWTQTGGTTTLANPGALLTVNGTVAVQGGVLKGTGTVAPALSNSGGSVQPGTSPGTLAVTGNYTQGAGGTLATEISGTTPGTGYDRLAVTGTATLDGTLAITTPSFTPSPGQSFQILTAGTRTGTFATVTGGSAFEVNYGATEVTLAVTDADGDGIPDASDACPAVPGPGTVNGCPVISRSLKLSYSNATHAFKGKLTASAPACKAGRKVKVLKKRPGPDTKIGRATTSSSGKYKVPATRHPGKYYSKAAKTLIPASGLCAAAKSATLTLH